MLHLHNPYPLLSPWVVRTAHAHGVPVVQTVHNYRQVCSSGLYFRDGAHLPRLPGPGVRRCRRSCTAATAARAAQSALMATTLAVHRPTWRSVDRYIALTAAIADAPARLRHPGRADRGQAERAARPGRAGAARRRLPLRRPGSPRRRASTCCWTPGGGTRTARSATLRIAGDGELRPLAEAAAAERADVAYLGPLDRAGVRGRAAGRAPWSSRRPTWHDVLPTVIIEALAHGRPVLGTALGGIPYLVGADAPHEPAGTGPAEIASAAAGTGGPRMPAGIGRARPVGWSPRSPPRWPPPCRSPGPARRAGPAARARYERTFHPDVVTKQLIDVYAAWPHPQPPPEPRPARPRM